MDLLSDIPLYETKALAAPMAVPSVFTLPTSSTNWTLPPVAPLASAWLEKKNEQPTARPPVQAKPPVQATPSFLPWSPLICNCINGEQQDGQFLYTWHRSHGMDKCTWFIRAKKAEADRIVKQYERESIKQERVARSIEKEAQLATKRKELGFTCKRCSAKFDSNTKLHEHVRGKHSKKPKKPVGEQKPPPPPTTAALATPPSSPSPPPAVSPIESPALSAPASPVTSPVTPPVTPLTTTPRKPISWAEVASRPKSPSTPSRLPRPIVKYGLPTPLPTPPLSPILRSQESANSIKKWPSTTPVKTPHLTVQDLYHRFHGKPKPSSLCTTQNGPQPASSSGQRRITSYFKPAGSTAELASARKYVDFRAPGQAVGNGDLALSKDASFSPIFAGHVQQPISSDMPHRHSDHCSKGTKGWSRADLSLSRSVPLSRRASFSLASAGHTQQSIVSDMSHRHNSHCSRGTKGWSCADSSLSKRGSIAEDSARHTCRRCTQHLISSDMSHRHSGHYSKGTERWPYASHPTLHTCRRCTQQFTSGNMLHRHLRHCFQCTRRWPSANGTTPFCPPSALPWGNLNYLPTLHPTLGESFYGLSPPLHYV